jgi:hypothetical protein
LSIKKKVLYLSIIKNKTMKNIKLTETECISVQHILKYFAHQNQLLDEEDKEGIRKLANKFE